MIKSNKDIELLLYPKTIAVVGATNNPLRVGARVIENTKRVGFKGHIYPVNPKYDELFGFKCYPSITDIPGEVDNLWIALPNEAVIPTLEEAESKGIRVATVYSSGWGETGPKGKQRERELKDWLANHNIRLLGPNTIGIGSTYSKVISGFNSAMNFFQFEKSGDIGFVSQSGAMVGGMVGRAEERGIELGYYIHTGNEVDINMMDVIEFMITDPKIKVILAYIEGIRNVDKFYVISKMAREYGKPLIFYKTGSSEKGKKVVASHTGAISGSDRVYDALLKQLGIIRVYNHESLFEVGSLFSRFSKCEPIAKGRILVFTPSGGSASIFADKAEEMGLELPDLDGKTKEELVKVLPAYTIPANPFDIGGGILSDPSLGEKSLDIVCRDPNVDILTWTLVGPPRSPLTAAMIRDFVKVAKKYNKPIAVHTLAGYLNEEGFKVFVETNSPTFDSIETCLTAIKYYINYIHFKEISLPKLLEQKKATTPPSNEVLSILKSGKGSLSEYQSKKLLACYGIPIPRGKLTLSLSEAEKAAYEIGYPVVLKISSRDILHKTEAGVLALDIKNKDELRKAYLNILKNARDNNPTAEIEGVLVEEMVAKGIETIIGSVQDPQFGPTVMFGLGGIFVELLKDVSLKVAPINKNEVLDMINEIKCGEILKGFRGGAVADIDAISETLEKIANLSLELKDWIEELDINPVVVYNKGKGLKAIDALIKLKAAK